uniref:Protein root UVB sensitive/RUS domain-containing protein n=1 Tax=Mycena chlorophos TaxID=658473 RepID=A0ABQ0L1X2_MYCCL|nr:predicted protein [Mycena chlorophos]
MTTVRVVERTDDGRIREAQYGTSTTAKGVSVPKSRHREPLHQRAMDFGSKVFLPSGYPHSVSPDYLRYQLFNALQAFCSSLAGLLSSRALLEGFGVGNADASATHALLLTVLQDFFGRITTICAAYALGPSLGAEAKTFRLLADVANDAAIVLDTLSPLILSRVQIPGARVGALCLSGALRAMCGICAGGSKAALSMHFATPVSGTGDIGDLNAKDSSKETVLALSGMLAGSLIVPYLTTPSSTYTVLFTLVGLHLWLNYHGVRGVVLRTLNRQRLSIAWHHYRDSRDTEVPSPAEVSRRERVLDWNFNALGAGVQAGRCTCDVGSSLVAVFPPGKGSDSIPPALVNADPYILWFDPSSISQNTTQPTFRAHSHTLGFKLHIFLRRGYSSHHVIKAWVHAVEVGRMIALQRRSGSPERLSDPLDLVRVGHKRVGERLERFLELMREKGWETRTGENAAGLVVGSPRGVIEEVEVGVGEEGLEIEGRKER